MSLEQLRRRKEEEGELHPVGLCEIQCELERTADGTRVAEGVACDGLEEKRLDYPAHPRAVERARIDDGGKGGERVLRSVLVGRSGGRRDPHLWTANSSRVGPTIDVDAVVQPVVPAVWLLLGTDGLTNEVGQDQIVSLMETSDEIGAAADTLVGLAVAHGGHDNIAVAEICD